MYKKSDKFLNFKKDLVLVDKFISSTDINEDRYYNNFFDKGKKNAIYLPTIVNLNIREIYIVIKKIQKSNKYFNISFAFPHSLIIFERKSSITSNER